MLKRLVGAATVDVSLLRTHRDFRLLYIGQLVSGFGNALTSVAVLYQVFALTHSSLAVGLLGLVEFAPLLLLAFVGGALADAFDRRRLVQVTELSLAGLSTVLAINALFSTPQLWLLFLVGALAAGLYSLQFPALAALLPRLVEREELVAAVALTRLRQSLGQIGGPALAGVLIAAVGLPLTYTVDVATFVVSLVALRLMLAVPPPPGAAGGGGLRNMLEGLRYVRGHPVLLGTFLTDLVGTFLGWPTAVFPALAVIYTRSSGSMPAATALGFLFAAPAVGALLASLISGWTRRVHHHGRGEILAVLVWGSAIAGLGLAPTLWLALACLALVGGANLISGIFRGAIANETVPDALRGRLAGIELISYSSGPVLGDVETGAIATVFTPTIAVFSGGILCLLGVGLVALAVPSLRRYDNRDKPG